MSETEKILGTDEAWESEQLGAEEKYARRANVETVRQIDDALGLQMISIRLEKSLIESFKLLGSFHGVGYQPLMRDALKRFAETEMRAIVSGLVQSQSQLQRKELSEKPEAPKPRQSRARRPRDKDKKAA